MSYQFVKPRCCCVLCGTEVSINNLPVHYDSMACAKVRAPKKPKSRKSSGGNQYTKARKEGLPIPKVSEETRNKVKESLVRYYQSNPWTEEKRKAHSKRMQKVVRKNPDSYSTQNVSGRVPILEYRGFKLKGSWELRVAQWLDSLQVQWTNDLDSFTYVWEGRERQYFPDFYLPEHDVYIEVKGYRTDRDVAKWSNFSRVLVIIDKRIIHDLDQISLPEIIEKYQYQVP